jgi:hypothetical protein
VPAAGEQAAICCAEAVGSVEAQSTIKVHLPAGEELAQKRPLAVHFALPLRDLSALQEALSHGPVEVVAVDREGRRVLGTGVLVAIDNAIERANDTVRLKAVFPAN